MLTQKIKLITILSLNLISSSFYYTLSAMHEFKPIETNIVYILEEDHHRDKDSHIKELFDSQIDYSNSNKNIKQVILKSAKRMSIDQEEITKIIDAQEKQSTTVRTVEGFYDADAIKKMLELFSTNPVDTYILVAAYKLAVDIIEMDSCSNSSMISIITNSELLLNIANLATHFLDRESATIEHLFSKIFLSGKVSSSNNLDRFLAHQTIMTIKKELNRKKNPPLSIFYIKDGKKTTDETMIYFLHNNKVVI